MIRQKSSKCRQFNNLFSDSGLCMDRYGERHKSRPCLASPLSPSRHGRKAATTTSIVGSFPIISARVSARAIGFTVPARRRHCRRDPARARSSARAGRIDRTRREWRSAWASRDCEGGSSRQAIACWRQGGSVQANGIGRAFHGLPSRPWRLARDVERTRARRRIPSRHDDACASSHSTRH